MSKKELFLKIKSKKDNRLTNILEALTVKSSTERCDGVGKTVTIKDVAQVVRVSKTIISRYINGNYGKMSTETKSKIQKAIIRIDKLNY